MQISSVLLVVVTASLTALVSSSPFPPQVAELTSQVVYENIEPIRTYRVNYQVPFYPGGSALPMYPRQVPMYPQEAARNAMEAHRRKRQIMGAGLGGGLAQSQSQAQSMGAGMGAGMMGAGLYNPFMMGMGMPFFG